MLISGALSSAHRPSLVLGWASLLLVLAVGCGEPSSSRVEGIIGSAGGSVRVETGVGAGAEARVPDGAVDSDTAFTIETGSATELPLGLRSIGSMVTFGPEGSLFAVPVRITLPAAREPMVLLTRPHGGGSAWVRVDGAVWDAETGLLTADVMHFSDFVPVERDVTDDAGVPSDGGDFCLMNPRDPRCVTIEPPLPGCDALAQDCAAGQMCIATDQGSGYDWGDGRAGYCIPAGTGTVGSACDAPSDCMAGTQCVFQTMYDPGENTIWWSQEESYLPMYTSICLPLCTSPNLGTGPGVSGSCTGGDVCHPIQLWGFAGREVNETYGVCAPPPPDGPPR